MIGKYLNGYSNQPAGPAGLVGVARGGPGRPGRLRLHAERERHPGPLRPRARRLQAGRADRKGGRLRQPPGAAADSRSSSGSPTRPRTSAARTRTRTRRSTAAAPRSRRRATPTRSTPSRCRGRRTSTRPTSPTSRPRSASRPRLSASQIADIQRKYRCELESLLSVDEGVKKVVEALRANGELDNTLLIFTSDNGFFHGEHRIPDGKQRIYEESIRVPLLMRGPGHPAGSDRRRPGDQRRPGADDRRRGEREPRPGHGRALADPGRAAARASSRDASS